MNSGKSRNGALDGRTQWGKKERKKGGGGKKKKGGGGGILGVLSPNPPPLLFRSANAVSRDHWENEFPQEVETEEGKNYFNDRQ